MRTNYYHFINRLRDEGKLIFWCSCGVTREIEKHMPFRMRCYCGRQMIIMDKEDQP